MTILARKRTVGELCLLPPRRISNDCAMIEAADLIATFEPCSLLVVDQNKKPWSIITAKEILRLQKRRTSSLEDFWQSPLYSFNLRALHTIDPECTIYDACLQMSAYHVKCLPVIQDGDVLGMVTLQTALEYLNHN